VGAVRAVGAAPERNVLILEKAAGELLWRSIERGSEYALEHTEKAAQWLAMLHGLSVDAPCWDEDPRRIATWAEQLRKGIPSETPRIEKLTRGILARLENGAERVPSHGDFHGGNVFIDSSGGVVAIDLDKFSLRERAVDVAYFLAQTASMGYWTRGSFGWTSPFQQRFLDAYKGYSGAPLDEERICVHMAAAFLQNLNYDLNVFKTGRTEVAPAFLSMAERSLFEGAILLREETAALS
jgi:Ser/Thr protein kinase RdoA (MazF antagonist)